MENLSVFFGAKRSFYDEYAKIQNNIANFTAKFAKENSILVNGFWLDLGSGTGFVKKSIINNFEITNPENVNIISLDIAISKTTDICADFDFLPFCENSFDKIISCSAIQWSKNIENLMKNIYEILKKDGKFIVSVFENGTLENLQKIQKKFNVLPQVSFFEKSYFENSAQKAGFEVLASAENVFSQKFNDGYSALKSISKIGASNHGGKFLSPQELNKFILQYEKSFSGNEIIHDYKTLFYILEKK